MNLVSKHPLRNSNTLYSRSYIYQIISRIRTNWINIFEKNCTKYDLEMYPDLYTINFESDKPPNYDQAATSNANGDQTLQNDESTTTSEKICTRCCPTLVILVLVGIIAFTFIGKIKRSHVASYKFVL